MSIKAVKLDGAVNDGANGQGRGPFGLMTTAQKHVERANTMQILVLTRTEKRSAKIHSGIFAALPMPFPPLLEPLAWLVGRWEINQPTLDRFPHDTTGPYSEILEFRPENVTMFDRPTLNFT